MVVAADITQPEWVLATQRFGTGALERQHLVAWLQQHGVQEIVMESTAQYWKPVWFDLEPHFPRLHLAQAHSNRAPKGRKHDFGDAQRLVRRLMAGELILSFVPDAAQRNWRMLTRGRVQLVHDRVRLQNQLEALLEQMRIKLSSVISDLLGLSGRRILRALADGERDPEKLAELGDFRLKANRATLIDALTGEVEETHQQLLQLSLQRLELQDSQIERLEMLAAKELKPYEEAVIRLTEVPGLGIRSAPQVIAEVGPEAAAFASPQEFASWVGICPGRHESAEHNRSSSCAKGNRYLRRILTEAAQAAVKKKGSVFQQAFQRWLPKLGYAGAIWAVAHKLCRIIWVILHDKVRYVERGTELDPRTKARRARKLMRALRRLDYTVNICPVQG
jgi:transposase